MDDKGTPLERFQAAHDAVFRLDLTGYPWWLHIEPVFRREDDGTVPAHWSYKITCGDPNAGSLQTREVAYNHVNNMIRTISSRTWDKRLDREGTAPSEWCQRVCAGFLRDPATVKFGLSEADEVLQMIMFDGVQFGPFPSHHDA